MGRHGDGATAGSSWRTIVTRRFLILATVAVLAAAATVALAVFWWKLRSGTDPISADPINAQGIVVSSPACGSGGGTKITMTGAGLDHAVTATVNACGYAPNQRLAVEYLADDPQQVRLAGTSTAGSSGTLRMLVPYAVLAAGIVAILALVMLLRPRRRSARRAGRSSGISVAELHQRLRPRQDHDTPEGTVIDRHQAG